MPDVIGNRAGTSMNRSKPQTVSMRKSSLSLARRDRRAAARTACAEARTAGCHRTESDGKLSAKLIDLFETRARPMLARFGCPLRWSNPSGCRRIMGCWQCCEQALLCSPSIFYAIVPAGCELFVRIVLAAELISRSLV